MLMKATLFIAALAAPTLAWEIVTCHRPDNSTAQRIVTSITPNVGFCTMLTGKGIYPVAPNEGCADVYCYGPASDLGPPTPANYILSANYAQTANYTQVTGCIDSAVWDQNPTDEGGQMDSHGWPYSCKGFKKFVSLLEPASNTYCLRCCNGDNVDTDCDTSHSTKGCWNLIPGDYSMNDKLKSACKPPVGAPVTNGTTPSAGVSGVPAAGASGTAPGTAPTNGASPSGGSGSSGSLPAASKPSSAGAQTSTSYKVLGAAAALTMAVVAAL
ncbi:hypothetical protein EMPS_09508 [Entomortierella parvispora]|uniref:Secreted protein n=1 Tax=Entomortierella parvispora TaxID=205924 RepID=A0A9P3HI40_9FUNG|nr:hypothetical protein EMPS_09508 [Entomortierella parvispora]